MYKVRATKASFLFFILFCSSCALTPVKTYPGAKRDDSEITHVRLTSSTASYPISIKNAVSDNFKLGDGVILAEMLPGLHLITFDWSFETAEEEEGRGVLLSWSKHGRCKISIEAPAGSYFKVDVVAQNSGDYFTDPEVDLNLFECDHNFKCDQNAVGRGACIYTGRTPSSMIKIDF